MKRPLVVVCFVLAMFAVVMSSNSSFLLQAQTTAVTSVPKFVRFSGTARHLNGNPMAGVVGITFSLYAEETGGSPLWLETQNATADSTGHYSVLLGSTKPDGLPAELFTSEQARWVGVLISGQTEQARALLVSAPYALKAGDAETVGGLPASAFVLANSAAATSATTKSGATAGGSSAANASKVAPANPAVTGVGVLNYIPLWDTTSDIKTSIMFQKSSEIGLNTTTPAATLDVNGKTDVRDTLTLFPKSTESTLAVSGTTFKVDSTGKVTFISGQTFPGTGAGTITGITTASGSGLSGGGTSGTLSLKVPAAGITNAMLVNSKVTLNASAAGGLTVPGAMTFGDVYTIGLKTCSANQVLQYVGSAWTCASVGTGTITGITTSAGSGLAGGGTSGTLNMSIPAAGVTNTMLANSKITLNASTAGGLTVPGAMTLGSTYTVGLKTCSANQVLEYISSAWTCATAGVGTVTSVATGTGLTGGTITGAGTLSINTSVVPQLAVANSFTNYQSITTNNSSYGLSIDETGNGDGIDITTSGGEGVYIDSAGDGLDVSGAFDGTYIYGVDAGSYAYTYNDEFFAAGVYGSNFGSTQETIGVYGYSGSPVGIGVYGQGEFSSSTGANTDSGFYPMGVWGDSGVQYGFGLFGTADDGWAFVGYNNSPSGVAAEWLENQQTSEYYYPVLFVYGEGFGGECTIDSSGDVNCTGAISGVASVDGGAKKVALNAIQSPEHWFEDAGSGQLSNGETVINIESVFGETINTSVDYHVFLTPNGDCKGLYVAQKSAGSFTVKELGGGSSSIAFDYRIMAKRKGFEQVRLADRTEAMSLKNRPIKAKGAAAKHLPSAQDTLKKQQQHAKVRSVAANGMPLLNRKK